MGNPWWCVCVCFEKPHIGFNVHILVDEGHELDLELLPTTVRGH